MKLRSNQTASALFLCKLVLIGVIGTNLLRIESTFAQETDIFAVPKTYAVQNRKYTLSNQLSAFFGYMPMDSFTKGVVFGASYTRYFTDFTGWEVLNGNYVTDIDTGLKDDLLNNFDADPGLIPDFPEWYVTTNIIYTPIYSKNLFFNKTVAWGDMSLVGGGGVASFQRDKIKPLVDVGLLLRFFFTQSSSFRLDFRENLPFLSSGVEPFMTVGIAYTYQFGGKNSSSKDTASDIEKEFNK